MTLYKSLIAGSALMATQAALAQTSTNTPAESPADAVAPADIIVTATKRGQNIQNVAASITAISAEELEQRGIVGVEDLASQVPNLNYSEHIGASLIYIRGIGTTVDTGVAEPSVATYVDGIFLPRTTMGLLREVDLERVEVLRGPQGTLYGRNATAGAINFVSRAPSRDFEGGVNLSTGSRNAFGATAYASGPLTDAISVRLSGGHEEQDGYARVINTGQRLGGTDVNFVRGAIRIEPSAVFQVDLSARYDESSAAKAYQQLLTPATRGVPATAQQTTQPNRLYGDARFAGSADTLILSGTANWKLSDTVTFRSITGYIDHNYSVDTDIDSTDFPLFAFTDSPRSSKSFSQEFNLLGETGGLSWLLGAYYFNEHAYTQLGVLFPRGSGTAVPAGTLSKSGLDEKIESYALFGDFTYSLSPRFRLNAGFRYNKENKRFLSTAGLVLPSGVFAGTANVPRRLDASDFLPKLGVQYDFSDEVHAYAQWQKGRKSGGLNLPGSAFYLPEKITSYEGGLKSRLFNRRLTANVAIFHYDFTNLQVLNVLPPATSVVQNADAKVTGMEAEFAFDVTSRVRLNAAVALLDAEYTRFNSFDPAFPANGGISLRGKQLNSAPNNTISGGVEWKIPLPGTLLSSLRLRGDAFHSDDVVLRYFGQANDIQKAYTTFSTSAVLTDTSEHLSLRLFVNNASNKLYKRRILYSASTGAYIGNYAEPRTWGAVLAYKF